MLLAPLVGFDLLSDETWISLRHKLHHGALKSTLTDFAWVKVNREFSFSIGNLFKNLRTGFEFFWFQNQRHFQVVYLTFDTFSVLVLKCFQSWRTANFVRISRMYAENKVFDLHDFNPQVCIKKMWN